MISAQEYGSLTSCNRVACGLFEMLEFRLPAVRTMYQTHWSSPDSQRNLYDLVHAVLDVYPLNFLLGLFAHGGRIRTAEEMSVSVVERIAKKCEPAANTTIPPPIRYACFRVARRHPYEERGGERKGCIAYILDGSYCGRDRRVVVGIFGG